MFASVTAAWIEAAWAVQGWLRPGKLPKVLSFLSRASPLLARWKPAEVPGAVELVFPFCCWHFMIFYISVSLCHRARRSDEGAWNTRICCGDKDTQGAHLETRMSPHAVRAVTALVLCCVAQEQSQFCIAGCRSLTVAGACGLGTNGKGTFLQGLMGLSCQAGHLALCQLLLLNIGESISPGSQWKSLPSTSPAPTPLDSSVVQPCQQPW